MARVSPRLVVALETTAKPHPQLAGRGKSRVEQRCRMVAIARVGACEEHGGVLLLGAGKPRPRVHAGVHGHCVFEMLRRLVPARQGGGQCTQVTGQGTIAAFCIANNDTAPREGQKNLVQDGSADLISLGLQPTPWLRRLGQLYKSCTGPFERSSTSALRAAAGAAQIDS
jgi:hypothetical protein